MRNASSLRRAYQIIALILFFPLAGHAQRACEDAVVAAPSGGWDAPLDTRVTLHARDVSLRDALDRLTAISRVRLAYSADYLPVDRRGGARCVVVYSATLVARLAVWRHSRWDLVWLQRPEDLHRRRGSRESSAR